MSAPRLDTQMAEVGCFVVYGDPHDPLAAEERQSDGVDRNGVVWLVDTTVDPESGEVGRLFRTVKQWRGDLKWDAIPADRVAVVQPPEPATIRGLIRAIGQKGLGKRGPLTSDHVRALEAMRRLLEAVVS